MKDHINAEQTSNAGGSKQGSRTRFPNGGAHQDPEPGEEEEKEEEARLQALHPSRQQDDVPQQDEVSDNRPSMSKSLCSFHCHKLTRPASIGSKAPSPTAETAVLQSRTRRQRVFSAQDDTQGQRQFHRPVNHPELTDRPSPG